MKPWMSPVLVPSFSQGSLAKKARLYRERELSASGRLRPKECGVRPSASGQVGRKSWD